MAGFLATDERSNPVPLMAPVHLSGQTTALSAGAASAAIQLNTVPGVPTFIEVYCPADTYLRFSATAGETVSISNGAWDLFVPAGQQVDVPVSHDRPYLRMISATAGSVIWCYLGAKVTY